MSPADDQLGIFESIILGIVQGITEFFPVSSDGHLAVAQELLDYHKNRLSFDVLLHMGTLGALFFVFWPEMKRLARLTKLGLERVIQSKSLKPLFFAEGESRWMLFVWWTSFVTGVVGLILEKKIADTFDDVRVAGVGFLITATFLFLGSWKNKGSKRPEQMAWFFPIILGLAQASALLPGISRSGMTIATALLFGIKREEAGRFSFAAAIPIIAMAGLYEMRHFDNHASDQLAIMLAGVLVSFVVGIFAIKGLLAMLGRLSLLPFAIYCVGIGLWTLLYLAK